ncbi:L-serine ammonia-lyase, iron-sulfur-dependent, subunit alpha [Peptoniphilus indolicus]|uniref:L-serine dehydratase n=2 Tax=Peptoniphilus indolicus TaxID=33030 RepID=G4D1J1_9FIRM|nr:L-serine ammonia-lyase, iron-sulfur-dependent, subunit alpha [Peptoniphilus indolicus]EGY80640.1 L-serine dehydratase alpha subunit [Peptoniphilus indolicus ATCC 29427]SUB74962.1 L-serine dehydratase, alpha chain [Peptoniphilus indolicus]
MLNTAREIIDVCNERGIKIYDLVLEEEIKNSHTTEEEIRKKLDEVIDVMYSSATKNLTNSDVTEYKMIDGFAKTTYEYATSGKSIVGDFLAKAMAMAFSTSEVNASMGKIVAAPTAGSSGIMPAMLVAASEKYNFDRTTIQNGFLTSIGIGQLIAKYATFAGAEGGCQAECGSASAMAASAIVEMLGGTVEQALHAASITIINVLGLVCDPIAGLVQYPCTFRNASGVINAFISADLALAGIESLVPFDEVVIAMGEVGNSMIEALRETGLGGLAGSKTGQKIRRDFLKEGD